MRDVNNLTSRELALITAAADLALDRAVEAWRNGEDLAEWSRTYPMTPEHVERVLSDAKEIERST